VGSEVDTCGIESISGLGVEKPDPGGRRHLVGRHDGLRGVRSEVLDPTPSQPLGMGQAQIRRRAIQAPSRVGHRPTQNGVDHSLGRPFSQRTDQVDRTIGGHLRRHIEVCCLEEPDPQSRPNLGVEAVKPSSTQRLQHGVQGPLPTQDAKHSHPHSRGVDAPEES
jgi:hypothetical protein